MDQQQRTSLGAEIARIRSIRPRITVEDLANAASVAPNTIVAAQRGRASDDSYGKILAAFETLGRPVEIVTPADVAPEGAAVHRSKLLLDVLTVTLRNLDQQQYEQFERAIWAVVRNQHEQMMAGLGQHADTAPSEP